MKKILLSILLVLTMFGITANAAMLETNYIIDEAQFSIDLPDDCYVLRQNISENNEYLNKTGAQKEDVETYFKENGIVVNAIAKDDSYELVATVNESESIDYVFNLQSLSDVKIQTFAEQVEAKYKEYGYTVEKYKIYEVKGTDATYIVFTFSQQFDTKQVKCRQYYTIRNNKIFCFTLRSYTGDISVTMDKTMMRIVDSINYFTVSETKEYSNYDVGVNFNISEAWKVEESTIENKTISGVQYSHTNGLGETIQFTYYDVWGNLSPLYRFFNTRTDIGEKDGVISKTAQAYTKGFFGNASPESIVTVKYGDCTYLTNETPIQVSAGNDTESDGYYMKNVVTARNGIVYAFQYGYYKNNEMHEKDFYSLLESITYEEPRLLESDANYYVEMTKSMYMILNVALLLVITFIVIIVLYIKSKVTLESA